LQCSEMEPERNVDILIRASYATDYMTKQNLDVIGSARCRPHQLPSAQTTKQNLDVIG